MSRTPRNLRGRVALVIGAAGGVGSATAAELVRAGLKVAIVDLARMDAPTHGDTLSHPEVCSGCSPLQGAPETRYRRAGPDSVIGEVSFGARHQGWPGIAHGGQVALVLDDAFGYLSTCLGEAVVTAHMEIDFCRPAPVNTPLRVTGSVQRRSARKLEYRVALHDGDVLIAQARSISIAVDVAEWNSRSSQLDPGAPRR